MKAYRGKKALKLFLTHMLALLIIVSMMYPAYADSTGKTVLPEPKGNILYRQPPGMASSAWYTNVIRLEHSSEHNGRLLATFFNGYNPNGENGIYISDDDGATWSGPISYVHDSQREHYVLWEPRLFELPQQVGDLPAGTILFAGRSFGPPGTWYFGCEIMIYYSTDGGKTWNYRSSVAYSEPFGTYEPHLAIAANGDLVCYYADETSCAEGDQVIGHKVSKDGGKTWGLFVTDVARPGKRPGMPAVAKLPDGRYAMSFEVVRDGASRVYVKFSNDGLNWGDPADFGNRVQTASGTYSGACPFITWIPGNGGKGQLVVSSSFVINSPLADRQLFINNNLGEGEWHSVPAPVQWQGSEEEQSQGYVQALLPTADGKGVIHFAASYYDTKQNEIRYGKTTIANASDIDADKAYFISSHYSCLNLENRYSNENNAVRQWNQNRTDSQLWGFEAAEKIGEDQYYYIYSLKETDEGFNKAGALEATAALAEGDYQAVVQEFNGSPNQQWRVAFNDDGTACIINRASDKALDVNSSQQPGALISVKDSGASASQKWYLTPYSINDVYPDVDIQIPPETDPVETDPNETLPDETDPEEILPDETIPDETLPDETKPDETKPDETEHPADTEPDEDKTSKETEPDATISTPPDSEDPDQTPGGNNDDTKSPDTGDNLIWFALYTVLFGTAGIAFTKIFKTRRLFNR